jgi:hypothetical protein
MQTHAFVMGDKVAHPCQQHKALAAHPCHSERQLTLVILSASEESRCPACEILRWRSE